MVKTEEIFAKTKEMLNRINLSIIFNLTISCAIFALCLFFYWAINFPQKTILKELKTHDTIRTHDTIIMEVRERINMYFQDGKFEKSVPGMKPDTTYYLKMKKIK